MNTAFHLFDTAAGCADHRRNAPLDLRSLVGEGWQRLPAAVQRRFASTHAETTYAGHMDLHCNAAGRVFAVLSRLLGAPLHVGRARAVPTRVTVQMDQHGGVVWERCFHHAGGRVHLVRSTKECDARGRLHERIDGRLRMRLDVFEHEGSLIFQSRRHELRLCGSHWRMPELLTPGRCRVTHTDLGQGRFRFTMEMRHALWGRTFWQEGVFHDPAAATPAP